MLNQAQSITAEEEITVSQGGLIGICQTFMLENKNFSVKIVDRQSGSSITKFKSQLVNELVK